VIELFYCLIIQHPIFAHFLIELSMNVDLDNYLSLCTLKVWLQAITPIFKFEKMSTGKKVFN